MQKKEEVILDKSSPKYKRRLRFKIATLVVYLLVMTVITIFLFPYAKLLGSSEGREHLTDYVADHRRNGVIVFVTIQAVQILIAVMPPIQILGGVMFGPVMGTVYSLLGVVIGSIVVYFLVKLIGYPVVEMLFDEKKIKKFKFLQNEKKVEMILFVLFIFPGIPKDMLTYLVPLTKIPTRRFFLFILPARIPAIILSAMVGSSISGGHFVVACVLSAFVVLSSFLGIMYRDKIIDKFHSRRQKKSEQFNKK